MILTESQVYDVVRRHGADPGADRCAVAAAKVESGWNTQAAGDNGHSHGLWQMYDQGLGSGMTVAARQDPDQAAAVMVPVFNNWYRQGLKQGYQDAKLARYTCMYTERPYGFPDIYSSAASAYATAWDEVGDGEPAGPPPPVVLSCEDQLTAEREWGSALQTEIAKWAELLSCAWWDNNLDGFNAVLNTMRENARGE